MYVVQYQIGRLKMLCEEELRVNMTVDSCADLYELADTYNAETLRDSVEEFISRSVYFYFCFTCVVCCMSSDCLRDKSNMINKDNAHVFTCV